ncbi:MAG: outer membrane protein assembly factor BamD [Saprospiraceae bacterium]|nr:outer membrane protein assembly factor BamD [Saprospiraceae bacterium]
MRKIGLGIIVLALFVVSGCKSGYEKIRNSGDPQLILKSANQHYLEKEYFKAQTLYELVLTSFRGQKEAEEIYFNYAQTHFYLKEYDLASYLFKNFANTFINSSRKEEADYFSVYSLYKTAPAYKLDQTATQKAIEGFQLFINSYPNSPKVADCNRLIDECRSKLELKAFEAGKLYFEMDSYQSSVTSFQNLLLDFPETKNDREVRLMICRASFLLAENSIYEKQKERYLEALEFTQQFLNKYPSGKQSAEVKALAQKINRKLKSEPYDRYQNTSSRN